MVMSGHTLQEIRGQWVDPMSGVPFFLSKPVTTEELRQAMHRASDMQEVTKR